MWTVMYTCVRGIDCFSVSMISFIIIIINVHVPDQYSERSCIHVSEVRNNQYLWHMYTWPFTVLVWYMYINNNNNKRYHRNRETIDTSDTCIHDRSLYWSGTCTFIIIIINVHVPDQHSERSCKHVSEVSIVSLFLWYLLFLLLLMYMQRNNRYLWHMFTWPFTVLVWYMYINNNNNNKDIIETEKQSIPLTHV
jgi:hypothetical protein